MSSSNPPTPSPQSTPPATPIQPDQTLEASTSDSAIGFPPISHLPFDLFVRKRHQDLKRGDLTFTDSSGNLVFRVDGKSSKSIPSRPRRLLLDDSGTPIFSILPFDGRWQGFKGESENWKDLVFRVQRTYCSLLITELEVVLVDGYWGESTSDFRIKGSPFQRSCTIYKGNSIVAQTSLLYKLRKVIVGRRRFKLTIFPGFIDHALIVALIVIYFDGRK